MTFLKYGAYNPDLHRKLINHSGIHEFGMLVLARGRYSGAYRGRLAESAPNDSLDHVDRVAIWIDIQQLDGPIRVRRRAAGKETRLYRSCYFQVLGKWLCGKYKYIVATLNWPMIER